MSEGNRHEEEREAALERFRSIAECISDGFYLRDAASGDAAYLSPAFAKIFGEGAEVRLRTRDGWFDAVAAADREALWADWHKLPEQRTFDREYRILRADGATRIVRDRGFLVPATGQAAGVVRDVTEERKIEAELRQAQRVEALGTLVGGIAHDFNNLLMGLGGAIDMGLRKLEPEHPARSAIAQSRALVRQGAGLTRRLLHFAGAGHAPPSASIELDSAVRAAMDLVRRGVGEHIEVRDELGAPGAFVRADAGDIEHLILSLTSNARDAMPGGGNITLRSFATGSEDGVPAVLLAVQDTGVGMDEATRSRAFEPFFTTKEVGKGTGLGLPTVLGIAKRAGGRVEIDSEPGRGTQFTIALPRVEGPIDGADDRRAAGKGGETVLLVEDEPLVRASVERYLQTLGYRTVVATDAADAERIFVARGGTIDVLVTDVMMPGRLGGDLARDLRVYRPALPVLFMSAHPYEELRRLNRIEAGAPVIAKPFDAHELGHVLADLLGPRGGAAAENGTALGNGAASGAKVKVLVVDDNPDIAETLREALELDGYRAVLAATGEEALEKANEVRPTVVLCDLSLGQGMSGYDVARKLRADERFRGAFLVAVTGHDAARCGADAVEAGFNSILTKPFELRDLEKLIARRATPRRATARS